VPFTAPSGRVGCHVSREFGDARRSWKRAQSRLIEFRVWARSDGTIPASTGRFEAAGPWGRLDRG